MIPWLLLASAEIPGGGGELRLYQRGSEYSMRVGPYELMNSRAHASEDTLALAACERIRKRGNVRVLIGGLGMGFTLAAVLKTLDRRSEVVVAELIPEVIVWNRGLLAAVAGEPLSDERVTVREGDVANIMRAEEASFDAILLDVDNGPSGLTSKTNDWLYGLGGLKAAFVALRPEGVLAIWSSGDDAAFTRRLHQAGFEAEQLRVRGRGAAGGSRYLIWLAHRP